MGTKKVSKLPLLHLGFESDDLQDETCKNIQTFSKFSFTVCDYKSLKTKSPQFLNSELASSFEASFLFTAEFRS